MNAVHTAEWLVGVVTSTGFLAILKSVFTIVGRIRAGQKVREPARREQIVGERDDATRREATERARADAAEARCDSERAARRIWEDAYGQLRWVCISHGTDPKTLPPLPTIPPQAAAEGAPA